MPSYSDKETEKRLAQLEKKIDAEYRKAWEELKLTTSEYFDSFQERDLEMLNKLENGDIDEAYYKQWRINQIGRGKRWEAMRDQMAAKLSETNKMAAAYINDTTPGIYSVNQLYEAYTIESVSNSVQFTLVNEQTAKHLLEGPKQILPRSKVNAQKDEAWNMDKIQQELLSGILQGDSLKHMADRFQKVSNMDRNAAIRNARTATTGAQNAGRQNVYDQAGEMGIELWKEWIATDDDRTRESHAELDGVRVPPGEEFPNGLMYPGDWNGDPAEIYNCRCTTRAVIPGFENENAHKTGHTVETYKEWLAEKEKEKNIWWADDDLSGSMYDDTVPKILTPDNMKATFSDFTVEELEEAGREINKNLDGYTTRASKWSGKIVTDDPNVEFGKLWSCDIQTLEKTSLQIIMHELLHSRSISYYDKKTYREHWKTEEAAVQYLAREISKANGIKPIKSDYDDKVHALEKINNLSGYGSNMDFAKDFFDVEVPKREDWLIEVVNGIMTNGGTVGDYMDALEQLERVVDNP